MLKKCTRCHQDLPLEAFHINRSNKTGYSIWCKACNTQWYRENAEKIQAAKSDRRAKARVSSRGISLDGMKVCSKCCESRPATHEFFGRNRNEEDGLSRTCRICIRIKQRVARDKFIASHLAEIPKQQHHTASAVRVWRINIRAEMIEAYGGRCECCGEDIADLLTLDHIGGRTDANHPWHLRRGGTSIYGKLKKLGWPKDRYRLLCMSCNWGARFTGICPHERALRLVVNNG